MWFHTLTSLSLSLSLYSSTPVDFFGAFEWLELDRNTILPSCTGFYLVLPSFIGFDLILLGFTGFYWVLPSFTGFYWVLLGFTGFYRVLLGFT